MQPIRKAIALLFSAVALGTAAASQAVPALDAARLLEASTHVAVLEVTQDEVTSFDTPWALSTALVREIKGSGIPASLTVGVAPVPRPLVFGGALESGDHVLAFLQPDGAGGYRLADAYFGLQRVSHLRAGESRGGAALAATLAEHRRALDDPNPEVVTSALNALALFGDKASLARIQAFEQNGDLELRATSFEARLRLGDATAFAPTRSLIESGAVLAVGRRTVLAWSILGAEASLDVAELNAALLDTTHPALASAAAHVLSRTGNRSSIPALVAGIGRPELETQYRSIAGLARIVDRKAPSYRAFMQDPSPYVQTWLQRAKARGLR